MRTKTVTLDDKTREVLTKSTIVGNKLTLPGQLPREEYMRVAKAIEAAGGKWNKKEKCHVFEYDVRETLHILNIGKDGGDSKTCEVIDLQQTYQSFNTPREVVGIIMLWADLSSRHEVLEPSAGTGNLIEGMVNAGVLRSNIYAVEIQQKLVAKLNCGHVVCGNFLTYNPGIDYDRIIMNPPFSRGDDIKHIKHALTMLKAGGRLVSVVADGPKQRAAFPNANWVPLPEKSFRTEGTNINTALIIL